MIASTFRNYIYAINWPRYLTPRLHTGLGLVSSSPPALPLIAFLTYGETF